MLTSHFIQCLIAEREILGWFNLDFKGFIKIKGIMKSRPCFDEKRKLQKLKASAKNYLQWMVRKITYDITGVMKSTEENLM